MTVSSTEFRFVRLSFFSRNNCRKVWLLSCLLAVGLQTLWALFHSLHLSNKIFDLSSQNLDASIALLTNSFQSQYSSATKSPFAYAFVIGGCDPNYPTYRHYMYNVLIAAKNLRERGSQSDVVVFFQMAWAANGTALPTEDEQLLKDYGIRILYLPKNPNESFYRTMFDKFRILGLKEYDRILFMDGDIMPMANLDYLLELSAEGILRKNVVVQGTQEPANGGFFVLKTGPLEDINDIIQQRQKEAWQIGYPYFNMTTGWGHMFQPPDDGWQSRHTFGTDWDFHGGFADQGLLYYWVKYFSKDVSICMHNGTIQHWFSDGSGDLVTLSEFDLLANHSNATKCWGRWCGYPPMRDFHHFTGDHKPWQSGPPQDLSNQTSLLSPVHYWFWQLQQLNEELRMGLNFSIWQTRQRPALGLYPLYNSIRNASVNLLETV